MASLEARWPEGVAAQRGAWAEIARPSQLPPAGDWQVWLIQAGRGFGKTRAGAEWVLARIRQGSRRVALIGPTASDVRDVMVEGESGLLNICPEQERPMYEPSKRRLTFPTGAMAFCYSAEEPERLRGPQHDDAWADEIGAWKYAKETWAMLMFGLRLGADPRVCATTTPRPIPLVKMLVKDPHTVVTRGASYENRENLAPAFFQKIITQYEGTRLGRQEIDGELLEDNPGALWSLSQIDALRVREAPVLKRVVVAVDPAVTSGEESDETGIVACGLGLDGHGYVLSDQSLSASPDAWARAAVRAYLDQEGDRLVAEVNNGGDLVEQVVRTVAKDMGVAVAYKKISASRGKMVRAEPIAALYEQGRVHHAGVFTKLEDQMCEYDPLTSSKSPDRMDAMVWALTELMLNNPTPAEGLDLS